MLKRISFGHNAIRLLIIGTLMTATVRSSISSETVHHWRFEDEASFLLDSVGTASLTAQNFDFVALPAQGRGSNFPRQIPGIGENRGAANTPPHVAGLTTRESTPIHDAFTIELFANVDDLTVRGSRSVLVSNASNPFRAEQFGWALAIERSGPVGDWEAVPRELELFASDGFDISQYPSGILIDEQTDYFLSASFDIAGDIRFYVEDLSDGTVQISNVDHSMAALRPDSTLQIGVPFDFAILDGLVDEVRLSRGVVPIEELLVSLNHVVGDVDDDGQLTSYDIDLIANAVQTNNPDMDHRYDINADGVVSADDHVYWVKNVKGTWMGDANLDGEFNTADLVDVFQIGSYETDKDAGWAQGDWTGDQRFDSADFVAAFADGGFEVGPRPATNAVPEPSCSVLLGIGVAGLVRKRQRR